MMITIEELTTAQDLLAIQTEWKDLWDRCPAATPFQSPEWVLPWWSVWGGLFQRGRIATLAARCEGKLAGLAPLFIDNQGTLRFLCTRFNDYQGFLLNPEAGVEVTRRMRDYLARNNRDWKWFFFPDLPQSSPLLNQAWPAARVEASNVCPVLTLPDSMETLLANLSAKLRKNLERDRKTFAREHTISFETRIEPAPEFFEALFRLQALRWPAGAGGAKVQRAMQRFHALTAQTFASRGWLRLHALRADEIHAALIYSFAFKRSVYIYMTAFDMSMARFGPGTLLLAHAIRNAIEEGFTEFDFLRGAEPYKYRWGAKDRLNYCISGPAQDFDRR